MLALYGSITCYFTHRIYMITGIKKDHRLFLVYNGMFCHVGLLHRVMHDYTCNAV